MEKHANASGREKPLWFARESWPDVAWLEMGLAGERCCVVLVCKNDKCAWKMTMHVRKLMASAGRAFLQKNRRPSLGLDSRHSWAFLMACLGLDRALNRSERP